MGQQKLKEKDGSKWNLHVVIVQATGMQRVSSDLDKTFLEFVFRGRTAGKERFPGEEFCGSMLSAPVIRALATELALKAIRIKVSGKYFEGHDLAMLFEKLDQDTRDLIEKNHKSSSEWSHRPVQSILEEHRNDFVRFRYLAEKPGGSIRDWSDMSAFGDDLRDVLCVLISTFNGLPGRSA